MAELDDARALARALVDVGNAAGLPTRALLTDMDRVLGRTAGNALEVRESIAMLVEPGAADARLTAVTLALARTVLDQGGLPDADPAAALASGAAAERFAAMVAALGGPGDLLERPDDHLEAAPVVLAVGAERAGVVAAHATRDLGLVVTELGGNRHVETDAIDHAVGLDADRGARDARRPGRGSAGGRPRPRRGERAGRRAGGPGRDRRRR